MSSVLMQFIKEVAERIRYAVKYFVLLERNSRLSLAQPFVFVSRTIITNMIHQNTFFFLGLQEQLQDIVTLNTNWFLVHHI